MSPTDSVQAIADDLYRTRALAYARRMTPGHFLSHTTSAWLQGLPVRPVRHNDRIHISAPVPQCRPRQAGVHGHEVDGSLVTTVMHHSALVADRLTSWLQLGTELSVPELAAIADVLLGGDSAYAPLNRDELNAAIERRGRSRGAGPLREALRFARAGSGSRTESIIRVLLHAHGLPEMALSVPIQTESGTINLALADPDVRLGIDVVDTHGGQLDLGWDSMRRNTALAELGWLMVTVADTQITTDTLADWRALAARITALREHRAARILPPPS